MTTPPETPPPETPLPETALMNQLDDLEAFDLEGPPSDFADKVLTEAHGEATAARPSSRRATTGLLAAVGAAAMLLTGAAMYWVMQPPEHAAGPSHGEVEAASRRTVEIPGRAVVVAEAGTRLSWDVANDGAARVRQGHGEAFYRVDPGESFEVVTPAGFVRVTGTCFTVKVEDMKKNRSLIKAGALGAALAAAAVVTVYEGEVVLANEKGDVTVTPGKRATARQGQHPTRDDATASSSNSVSALKAQNKANQRELARLRGELAERDSAARPDNAGDGEDADAPDRLMGGPAKPEGFSYFEPTQAALEHMADCGIVAWDNPPVFGDGGFDEAWRETAGIDAGEGASVDEAVVAFREGTAKKLREFYVELGGDPDAAETFSARELLQLTYSRLDMEELVANREAIAREKAGREPAPEDASATGRFMRWEASLGDAFEQELGTHLTPARARELRTSADGWGSNRLTYTNLCDD